MPSCHTLFADAELSALPPWLYLVTSYAFVRAQATAKSYHFSSRSNLSTSGFLELVTITSLHLYVWLHSCFLPSSQWPFHNELPKNGMLLVVSKISLPGFKPVSLASPASVGGVVTVFTWRLSKGAGWEGSVLRGHLKLHTVTWPGPYVPFSGSRCEASTTDLYPGTHHRNSIILFASSPRL